MSHFKSVQYTCSCGYNVREPFLCNAAFDVITHAAAVLTQVARSVDEGKTCPITHPDKIRTMTFRASPQS